MHAPPRSATDRRQLTSASLRRIPFLHDVPDDVLAPLAAVSARQTLAYGDTLWQPDAPQDSVFALATGVVRLCRYRASGKELTVALLRPGQLCGLADLDAAFVPTTLAQALSDGTVIYPIPRRHFARFLLANPALALRALAATHQHVRDSYDLMELPDVRARAAYILACLAMANGDRIVWTTHEELAAWAHGRREALTEEVLPDLRARGLIAYERHRRGIRVLDHAGLLALARDDHELVCRRT